MPKVIRCEYCSAELELDELRKTGQKCPRCGKEVPVGLDQWVG